MPSILTLSSPPIDSFNGILDDGGWRTAGIAEGLHTKAVLYFVVDPRHYWDYGAAPWWDSVYKFHHKNGYIHIGGTYGWRIFGGRPDTQIGAARWMVENALHTDDFCERRPVWSKDGSKIAFESDRDGDWDIYAINADGSDCKQLTNSPGDDTAAAWSPDGRQIAFSSDLDASGVDGN